jgi:hypothetical protein
MKTVAVSSDRVNGIIEVRLLDTHHASPISGKQ